MVFYQTIHYHNGVKSVIMLGKLKQDCKQYGGFILLVLLIIYLSQLFEIPLCFIKRLTGYPCPLCGVTRASLYLVTFQFQKAWSTNLSIYFIVFYFLELAYSRYVKKINRILRISTIILILVIIVNYCYGMIYKFPNIEPYTHYSKI